MKTSTLVSRIRREAAASPKKAAILGILLVVAVAYWMPLVWGWVKPDSSGSPVAAAKPARPAESPVSKPVALDTAASRSESGKASWKQTSGWMESDPRMTATSEMPGRADPFDPVGSAESEQVAEGKSQRVAAARAAQAVAALTPANLGVTVSSTIIGSRGRSALINGKGYLLGQTIRVDHHGRAIDFELTDIREDRIVLRRNDRDYEVGVPVPRATNRLEVNPVRDN